MPTATHHPRPPRSLVRLAAAVAVALAAASCSGERPTLDAAPSTVAAASTTTTASSEGTDAPEVVLAELPPSEHNLLGFIATPTGTPVVHEERDAASPTYALSETTALGAPTTFAVVGDPVAQPDDWYRVMLPIRPNDATGWVQASTVELTRTDLRVVVDLDGRSLRLQRGGADVFDVTVAIGTEDNPTPTGVAFVTELVENVAPTGAYGPYAIGLSSHSDTLTEFKGGDGQVGIHGTNRPELIGDRVSHGCVRLRNDDIERLVDFEIPLGTPVFVA